MTARSRSKPRQGRGYSPAYDASAIAAKMAIVEQFRKDGMRIFEIARRHGVSDTTIYNWRKQQQAQLPHKTVERELASLRLEIAHMRARLDVLHLPHQAGPSGAES